MNSELNSDLPSLRAFIPFLFNLCPYKEALHHLPSLYFGSEEEMGPWRNLGCVMNYEAGRGRLQVRSREA